jgi:hypothetical protein
MKRITVLAATAAVLAFPAMGATSAFAATHPGTAKVAVHAKHGADDPVGHRKHHRHGADDPAGHNKVAGKVAGKHGADDPAGHRKHHRHGADDPAGHR